MYLRFMNMSESINAFLIHLSFEKNYAALTVEAYKRDLESFHRFMIESKDLDALNPTSVDYEDCRSWMVDLSESQLSKRTINRKMSALKSFYKFMVQQGAIDKSPLLYHRFLKMEKKSSLPFNKEELDALDQLIEVVDFESSRDALMMDLLYTSGIRRAELIGLQLKDIDVSQQQIKVLGKGAKFRLIPVLPQTMKKLQVYLEFRSKLASNDSHLFLTSKGNKCYPNLVYRIINLYLGKVSTKLKRSPHMLRHTFATHMIDEGADLNTVKELLGHSSLAATQVYTHSSLSRLKSVYNRSHPRRKKK